jgi:regulator of nonsense transcripts 1
MTNQEGQEFIGCASHARGKSTTVQLRQGSLSGVVERVRVIGREELTMSERARDEFVLLVLRGERSMSNSPFRILWFPSVRHLPKVTEVLTSTHLLTNALNESQRKVVGAMHADHLPLVITHGRFFHAYLLMARVTPVKYRSTRNWKDLNHLSSGQNLG